MSVKRKRRATGKPAKPERKAKGGKGRPAVKGGAKGKAVAATPPAAPRRPEPTKQGAPGDPKAMYGGFALRLYDHDWQASRPAVYDREVRKVIFPASAPVKAPVATGTAASGAATVKNVQDEDTRLIAKLQRHLWDLGFWVFPRKQNEDGTVEPAVNGEYDWRTEWAVREFQAAAAMPNVAVQDVKKAPTAAECKMPGRYLSSLSAAKNDKIFPEHPSGVVTAKTIEWIKHWQAKHYRCPLVIQALKKQREVVEGPAGKKGEKPKKKTRMVEVAHRENIWCFDEVQNSTCTMYAWDFSGHYDVPRGMPTVKARIGSYQPWRAYGGPLGRNNWDCARLTPESWHGKSWQNMSDQEKSTWRAIMAVAAQECGGGLDVINAWDNCLGSAGHFHWTMPKWNEGKTKGKKVIPGTVAPGEYCGLVSYLETKYPAAFDKCFKDFGLWGPAWNAADATAGRARVSASAVYVGYVYTKDDKGTFLRRPVGNARADFDETNWLRGWPWIYRLQLAARTCEEYRQATWDMAYQRIKNILLMTSVDSWFPAQARNAAGTPLTIGDVVTSEQGVASMLRLHVRWSSALGATGKPILRDAVKRVLADKTLTDGKGNPLDWKKPAKDWEDAHEVALVDAIIASTMAHADPKQVASVTNARFWPLKGANGRLLTKKIKTAKATGKEVTAPAKAKDVDEVSVPLLVGGPNTKWVPKTTDPSGYGPQVTRGSFKRY